MCPEGKDLSQAAQNEPPQLHVAPGGGPISYGSFRAAEPHFWAKLNGLVEDDVKRVCEVGGGAKPAVSPAKVQRLGLEYVVLDESQTQLDNAPEGYHLLRADILDSEAVSELIRQHGSFDLVVSRWTAEHISDGKAFHEQVFRLLRPGGTAVHFFPTLYALPFLVNRVLSPGISAALLFRTFTAREKKFRAYYSWCRGPTQRQIKRIEGIGFSVESYIGFFGHNFYARVKPLGAAHTKVTDALIDHPLPSMTSFALAVLRRPA